MLSSVSKFLPVSREAGHTLKCHGSRNKGSSHLNSYEPGPKKNGLMRWSTVASRSRRIEKQDSTIGMTGPSGHGVPSGTATRSKWNVKHLESCVFVSTQPGISQHPYSRS